jgi:hypothetical protein
MAEFHIAHRTEAGSGPRHDAVVDGRLSYLPGALHLVALVRQPDSLESLGIPIPLPKPPGSIEEQLSAVGFDVYLRVVMDPQAMTLEFTAVPGVLHYFRLADATLLPLPPEHAPAGHQLVPGRGPAVHLPLKFSPGDAYVAVSPGGARLIDSPALARFIHLRDYFNADKLAEALQAHLLEAAGPSPLAEDVTVLVVEAR